MNVNFEYSKTLAGEGSILLLLSLVPYVGWVLGIVGIVLLAKAIREFSYYYQDESIYNNAWTGLKYLIVAIIAAAVAIAAIVIGAASATAMFAADFVFTGVFVVGLVAFLAGLVVAFIFYVLAANHLKGTLNTLAAKSGEQSFNTAATLLWLGAILTILAGLGLILIFIACIFLAIGFFSMKPQQYQPYTAQPNGYTTPPPPPTQTTTANQNSNIQP
jgi:uncharacterized membrane protein